MKGTKEDYIKYRITKSDEALDDASLLSQNKRWNSCVNRLYYSCFYLVSALLYKEGIKAETHKGARTAFFQHYIKTDILHKDLGILYSNLFDWRHESDYADFIDFDEETVKPLLESVLSFNNSVKSLLDK
jgi:uncharacterized protein (UPF0332 family)